MVLGGKKKLRIFPIIGSTQEELLTALDEFIIDKLRIPCGVLSKEDVVYVRKVKTAKKSKIQDELLVVFESVHVRDLVQSYARNLAEWTGTNGKPMAGLRLEIPEKLLGDFKSLEQYGHAMREKHGVGFKRHIKLDDSVMGLYMDVYPPQAKQWIRVDMDLVREDNLGRRAKIGLSQKKELLYTSGAKEGGRGAGDEEDKEK